MNKAVSIVTYSVDSSKASELHQQVQDHLIPAARSCRGYRGILLIDQGDDKRMGLLFFDTPADAAAAQAVLTPIGEEHTYALMSGPAVGSIGMVVLDDGLFPD